MVVGLQEELKFSTVRQKNLLLKIWSAGSFVVVLMMLSAAGVRAQDNTEADTAKKVPETIVHQDMKAPSGAYNTEIAARGLIRRYPQQSGDGTRQREAGIGALYSFNPLVHDDAHRSMASKAVIPTSWVGATFNYGPFYDNSATTYTLRLFGAGLVSDKIGIGAGIMIHELGDDGDLGGSKPWRLEPKSNTYSVLVDIFASKEVHLREVLGFGTAEANDRNTPSDQEQRSIFRFAHYLQTAASRSFAYSHELFLYMMSTENEDLEYWTLTFNHLFEISTSEVFTIAPVIKTEGEFTEADERFILGGGFRVIVYPSPNVLLHFTPEYLVDPEEPREGFYNGSLVVGIRF